MLRRKEKNGANFLGATLYVNKKLGYCLEAARRESLPVSEILDVEMTS